MKKEVFNISKKGKRAVLIMLLLGSISIVAQVGVTLVEDVNNDLANRERQAAMLKQLQEAQAQGEKLQGMKETIKKNLDYLEQVNSNLQNVQTLKDIAKRQAQIYNNCIQLKNMYSRNVNMEVVLYTTKSTNQILQGTQNNINEVSKILSSGVFNMGDADRLQLLRQYKEDTEEAMAQYDMVKGKAEKYAWAMGIYNMKR